jgi:predicted component of type VI protein secretion system
LIAGDVLSIGDCEMRVAVRGAIADRSAGTAARWQLILDDDVASVQVSGDVIIGSEADCGIRLPDGDVAAHHAQLVLREEALWLRDFSDGATFVNDDPVRGARRLEPDDRVRIGPHQFRAAQQTLAAVEWSRPRRLRPHRWNRLAE